MSVAEQLSQVPLFFDALHQLQDSFLTRQLLADADVRCVGDLNVFYIDNWLRLLQITPSEDTTYSLAELVQALSVNDFTPYVSSP